VLLRDGAGGLETLLLRRSPRAGFAPGAFVFPGGLIDPGDAAPLLVERLDGLSPERAATRLGLEGAHPPAIAYYVAAVREAFEETGILLTTPTCDARALRTELLDGHVTFVDVLMRLECHIAAAGIEYFAHWITPVRSPRRYDTRFFATRVASDAEPVVDEREMTEALWTSPADALRAHQTGSLPMILPTVRTLERLVAFRDASAALDTFRHTPVSTILPDAPPRGFAGPIPQARLPK
jgi:8-oxo-dGTP pyrophosphatase MutT (NUDIX family)